MIIPTACLWTAESVSVFKPGENGWHFTLDYHTLGLWAHQIKPYTSSWHYGNPGFIRTAAGTYSAITDLVRSVLFNAYVSSLLAALSPHLCRDMICLFLILPGNLSTITTAHSLCRQGLDCVSPALGQHVWHNINGILFVDRVTLASEIDFWEPFLPLNFSQ